MTMHQIQPAGETIFVSLRSSLAALEPESERALEEAAKDLTRSTRFPEEAQWEEDWREGTPTPWTAPVPLAVQLDALKYRVAELEYLLRKKEGLVQELMEQLAMIKKFDDAHHKVKFFSLIGALCLSFAIAIYWLANILIVNPLFSLFGILACGMFWLMAVVDERASREDDPSPNR
jgi:hypothetical protein